MCRGKYANNYLFLFYVCLCMYTCMCVSMCEEARDISCHSSGAIHLAFLRQDL